MTWSSSPTSATFPPDVPISMPMVIMRSPRASSTPRDLRGPWGAPLWPWGCRMSRGGPASGSRHVVLQEDVDVDALLDGQHAFARQARQREPACGAHLVAGVLVDDRVGDAVEQRTTRMRGQLVADPDDMRRAPAGNESGLDAAVAGADAIQTG